MFRPLLTKRFFSQRSAQRRALTIPNILSGSRIVLTPFLAYSIVQHDYQLAMAMYGYAVASDVADGIIARNANQQSILGSYLDPMADKVMTIGVVGAMGVAQLLSPWAVGLLVAKDVCLMLGTLTVRLRSLSRWTLRSVFAVHELPIAQVAPSLLGKFAAVQVAALIGMALMNAAVPDFLLHRMGALFPIKEMEYLTLATTIGASFHYLANWRKTFPQIGKR